MNNRDHLATVRISRDMAWRLVDEYDRQWASSTSDVIRKALYDHPSWRSVMYDPREADVRFVIRKNMDRVGGTRGIQRGYGGDQVKAALTGAEMGRLTCICAAWDVSRSNFMRAALARVLYAPELAKMADATDEATA